MSLKEQIKNDMISAMKDKEKTKLDTIRMLKADIQMRELNKRSELTEEEVVESVIKQVKMRKESIKEFAKGNREDLISKTEEEIIILEKYLPEQMSKEDVIKVIDDAISTMENPNMGLVMKQIIPALKGKADMSMVNILIKERLQ